MGPVHSLAVDAVLSVWVGFTKKQDGSVLYVKRDGSSRVVSKEEMKSLKLQAGKKRIVCISDTHGYHKNLDLPGGDLLVLAGDVLLISRYQPESACRGKIRELGDWLRKQPCKDKLIVGGNHDLPFESFGKKKTADLLGPGVTYADHEKLTIQGLNIFASPRSFGKSKNIAFQGRRDPFHDVPSDIDILVTHHPARDDYMETLLKRTAPRLHVGGHYHWMHGASTFKSTLSVTASILNEKYKPTQLPIVVDL